MSRADRAAIARALAAVALILLLAGLAGSLDLDAALLLHGAPP